MTRIRHDDDSEVRRLESGNVEQQQQQQQLREPLLLPTTHNDDAGGDDNSPTFDRRIAEASGGDGMNEEGGGDNNNDEDANKDIVLHYSSVAGGYCCCPALGRRSGGRSSVVKQFRMNHNVFLNLVLSLTYGLSDSLWNDAVFTAYLQHLFRGRNAPLGRIEAVQGLTTLLTAVPIGWAADTFGKARLIRLGSFVVLLTVALQVGTTYWIGDGGQSHYRLMVTTVLLSVCMGLWGVTSGVMDGPCYALLADSTRKGAERARYYTYLDITYTLASALGPVVTVLLFASMGNEWHFGALQTIVYVGLTMEAMNAFIMMGFDDDKALAEEEEEDDDEDDSSSSSSQDSSRHCANENDDDDPSEVEIDLLSPTTTVSPSDMTPQDAKGGGHLSMTTDPGTTLLTVLDETQWQRSSTAQEDPLLPPLFGMEAEKKEEAEEDDDDDSATKQHQEDMRHLAQEISLSMPSSSSSSFSFGDVVEEDNEDGITAALLATTTPAATPDPTQWIPHLLFLSSLVSALASGLTDTFIPLYLKDDCGMSPVQVQLLYAVTPLGTAALTALVNRWSHHHHHGNTDHDHNNPWRPVTVIAICYLLSILLFAAIAVLDPYVRHRHLGVLVMLYFGSSCLGHAIDSQWEALLMDYVPKRQRARWMSLDALHHFGWSGTAILGGYVCDWYGYRHAFFMTCAAELVGWAVFLCVVPLVWRRRRGHPPSSSRRRRRRRPSMTTTASSLRRGSMRRRRSGSHVGQHID